MYENKMKNIFFYTLLFFPLYLTPSGIFIADVSANGLHLGERGLVFPLIFFISFFLAFRILINITAEKSFPKEIFNNLIINAFIIMGIFLSLLLMMGIFLFNDYSGVIKVGQFLTGGLGIAVSIYFFVYKKIDIIVFFGMLATFFTFIIIIHFFTSLLIFNLSPFSGEVYPSILGFGIYQSRVYYPYIVSMIFFSGLPYLIKRWRFSVVSIYLIYLFYIFVLQVRGALGSFILMSAILLFLVLNNKYKFVVTLILILISPILINISNKSNFLGRFSEIEKLQDLNGRTDLWFNVLEDINFSNFLFGTFLMDYDGITAHNQFFELLNLGGFFPVLLMFLLLVLAIKIFYDSIKLQNFPLKIFSLLMITQMIIDFNINVPLLNTNPAIHYWFFWSAIYFYYVKVKKESLG